MFAKILLKIRWFLDFGRFSFAVFATVTTIKAAEGDGLRVCFNFESQFFALRVVGGKAEAVVSHGGRIDRRGDAAFPVPLQRALAAVEAGAKRSTLAATRDRLAGESFFLIVHPRFTVTGSSRASGEEVSEFLAACRSFALSAPAVEPGGLYLLAWPAKSAATGESAVETSAPALGEAFAQWGFPVRVTDVKARTGLPKDSMYSARTPDGRWYLVSYLEGAPFSIAEWFRQ